MSWEARLFLKYSDRTLLIDVVAKVFDVNAKTPLSPEQRRDIYFSIGDIYSGFKLRDEKLLELKTCSERTGFLERWSKEKLGNMKLPSFKQPPTFAASIEAQLDPSSSAIRALHAVAVGNEKGVMVWCTKRRWSIELKTGDDLEIAELEFVYTDERNVTATHFAQSVCFQGGKKATLQSNIARVRQAILERLSGKSSSNANSANATIVEGKKKKRAHASLPLKALFTPLVATTIAVYENNTTIEEMGAFIALWNELVEDRARVVAASRATVNGTNSTILLLRQHVVASQNARPIEIDRLLGTFCIYYRYFHTKLTHSI